MLLVWRGKMAGTTALQQLVGSGLELALRRTRDSLVYRCSLHPRFFFQKSIPTKGTSFDRKTATGFPFLTSRQEAFAPRYWSASLSNGAQINDQTTRPVPNLSKHQEAIFTESPLLATTEEPSTAGFGRALAIVRPLENGVEKQKRLLPLITVTKPLPRVLLLHTGGTLGMDPALSFEADNDRVHLREGTGGTYKKSLQPRGLLADLLSVVPELQHFANLDVQVVFNKDSCRVGPADWVRLARIIHQQRDNFSAFIVVHGTDTMAYTASALSLMLAGFRKPIVLTGSQLPLSMPRSDARQNLIDSISCATSGPLAEVCVCFGGVLLRGNRAQKTNASVYRAFSSATYPHLANLGLEVEWDPKALLKHEGVYRPRFQLNPNVIRIPIVPGCDPRIAYGDLWSRGVRGLILEAFGVGNMPDTPTHGWLPWLRQQRKKGMQVYLSTQCDIGYLQPELYRSGSIAVALGVEAGPQMTPECACCKMMLCIAYPDIPLGQPIAGEL